MEFDDTIRSLFKSGIILLFGTGFELAFAFFGKLLIARHLGRVEYGSVAIGITFLTFTASISILGVHSGLSRYIPRFDDLESRKKLIVSGFVLALPLPAVIGFFVISRPAFVANLVFRAPETTRILPIFGAVLPFTAFVYLAIEVTRGWEQSVPKVVIQNFIIPFSRLGLISIGFLIGASAFEFSLAYALPYVIASVVAIYYLNRLPVSFLTFRRSGSDWYFRELLTFSIPLVVTAVMSKILSSMDTFLLSYIRTTGEVGTYNVIYPLAQLISIGLTAIGFMFMPLLSGLHADDQYDEMQRLFQIGSKWITMVALPLVLVLGLFPSMSIKLTFGEKYTAGAAALTVLSVGFLADSIFGLNANVLTSIGRTRVIAVANFFAALLNIALNLLLIPQYALFGAAFATTASLLLLNISLSLYLYRETGLHPFSTNMIRPFVIASVLVGAIYWTVTNILVITPHVIVVMYGVFLLLYGVSILRFGGIEAEEVMIVRSIEERFEIDLEPIKKYVRIFMP